MDITETNGLGGEREARLDDLRRRLDASERMGLNTRAKAIQAEIDRLEAE